MSVELNEEAEYKLRYATAMARIIGTFEGCSEAADDAWDCRFVNGGEDISPEESAAAEVAYWREIM